MNIQLTGASLSPFPRRKNMATKICLTISLGHGLEDADTTGKSYRFHYWYNNIYAFTPGRELGQKNQHSLVRTRESFPNVCLGI